MYLIIEIANFTFLQELLLFSETHLLVDAVGPHVGVVEAGLGVHVLRHHGHPVGETLGPSSRPAPADCPAPAGHRLGVATPGQAGLLANSKYQVNFTY